MDKDLESGDFSFDEQCKRLKNSKKTRRKMKDVIHLRSRVEDFHCPVGNRYVLYHVRSSIKSNFLSGGVPLSCESLSQFDFRNCNRRIANGKVGNIS